MGLLFESSDESTGPSQRLVKIIHTKEQYQSVARFRVLGAGQGWMLVRTPLVEAKQDRVIRVKDLPEVVMGGKRFW